MVAKMKKPNKHIEAYWNFDEIIDYLENKYKINKRNIIEATISKYSLSPERQRFILDVFEWSQNSSKEILEVLQIILKEFKEYQMNCWMEI